MTSKMVPNIGCSPSYGIVLESNPTSELQDNNKMPTAAREIASAAARLVQYSDKDQNQEYDQNGY